MLYHYCILGYLCFRNEEMEIFSMGAIGFFFSKLTFHMNKTLKSAYELKNNLSLFESPFKIQKNDVFLFEISFFVLEISTFFYYAN